MDPLIMLMCLIAGITDKTVKGQHKLDVIQDSLWSKALICLPSRSGGLVVCPQVDPTPASSLAGTGWSSSLYWHTVACQGQHSLCIKNVAVIWRPSSSTPQQHPSSVLGTTSTDEVCRDSQPSPNVKKQAIKGHSTNVNIGGMAFPLNTKRCSTISQVHNTTTWWPFQLVNTQFLDSCLDACWTFIFISNGGWRISVKIFSPQTF